MSTALTLVVSFTGHPEYPLMVGAAVLVVIGAAWPGPRSPWSRLQRWRSAVADRPGRSTEARGMPAEALVKTTSHPDLP